MSSFEIHKYSRNASFQHTRAFLQLKPSYIYVCMCVCARARACVCVSVCLSVSVYIHTHTYTEKLNGRAYWEILLLMGWTIRWSGFNSWQGLGILLYNTVSRPAPRPTQPPIQWVPGAPSLGVNRLGHEADHLPPSSVSQRKHGTISPLPQHVFMVWCVVKHRDNF